MLGGQHHFPLLLPNNVAAPSHAAGAFAMLYYEDRGVRSVDEVRVLATHIAEALRYLHSLGYVHCDVKRSNVRFDGTDAYLIDLDIAVRWQEGEAALCIAAGTPGWQAPEVLAKPPALTNKADVYGLGMVCLDEMLALSYANNYWRGAWLASSPPSSLLRSFSCAVGRYVINATPEGVRRLLSHRIEPADIEFVLELLQAVPSRRPNAAQVLQLPFVLPKYAMNLGYATHFSALHVQLTASVPVRRLTSNHHRLRCWRVRLLLSLSPLLQRRPPARPQRTSIRTLAVASTSSLTKRLRTPRAQHW